MVATSLGNANGKVGTWQQQQEKLDGGLDSKEACHWMPKEPIIASSDCKNNNNDTRCTCAGENDDDDDDKDADEEGGRPRGEKNLDSGYAWLILLVMFLLQSSISGASRVYGIVYAKEVATGYYDREQASWPIATASAVENLAGILTPALASFLSWRKIELLSTILFIAANLLAYYSNSLTVDILALGLIQGLALSTCTVLSLVINNDYFEHYRTTAYGIQMSGSTFGVLYLSPLVSWLLEKYDNFRLVYLALAIVFCGNIFLVLFIKPRAKTISEKKKKTAVDGSRGQIESGLAKREQIEWHGGGGGGDEREQIAQIKKVLESLDSNGQQHSKLRPSQSQLQVQRKRSRFESHFERKNSIASISYQARSRRQSILSRQRVPVGPATSCSSGPPMNEKAALQRGSSAVFTIDGTSSGQTNQWPLAGGGGGQKNMIIKSQSGIELDRRLGCNAIERLASNLSATNCEQRLSLDKAHSIEATDHQSLQHQHNNSHQQQQEDNDTARRRAKLSVTNSLASFSNNHLLRHKNSVLSLTAGSGAGAGGGNDATTNDATRRDSETTCEDNVGLETNSNLKSSNNARLLRLSSADLESGTAAATAAAADQHDLSSSPAMLLQSKQQYLVECCQHSNNTMENHAELAARQKSTDERHRFSLEQTVGLLRLPYLHCTWMMLALYYLIARVFVIILVDFADDHGFSLSESTNLLNYWSIGELVGRVLLGPLIDLQYMSCKSCIVLTCSLLASCILFMVLVESYLIYAFCSMCIAALISLEYMLINVLMVEYVGKEHVTNCYSLAACLSSLVLFSRPSLIGLFRDQLGSYDGLLILLASITLTFAIFFYILEPVLVRKWPKRQHAANI